MYLPRELKPQILFEFKQLKKFALKSKYLLNKAHTKTTNSE